MEFPLHIFMGVGFLGFAAYLVIMAYVDLYRPARRSRRKASIRGARRVMIAIGLFMGGPALAFLVYGIVEQAIVGTLRIRTILSALISIPFPVLTMASYAAMVDLPTRQDVVDFCSASQISVPALIRLRMFFYMLAGFMSAVLLLVPAAILLVTLIIMYTARVPS